MADTNDECEQDEMFNKILNTIKEYSNEDITHFKKTKAQIMKLLKTHRPVKLVDFEFGLSHLLKKDYRLIVKEENDKSKVREYTARSSNKYWYCTFAGSLRVKCHSSAKFKFGILFVSKNHEDNCVIKEYSFVMQIQNLLKQKKTSEVFGLSATYKSGVYESLSTSMPDDSTPSTTLKREPEVNDYCMILDEPAAKRPKVESNDEEIFPFDLPSAVVLKEKCQLLKIEYNYEAYKFWGQIEFVKIITVTDEIQTDEFKSRNIFACLSLLFSGKVNNCFSIQHAINSAFCAELTKTSLCKNFVLEKKKGFVGSLTSVEIDQAFANTTVTDDHLQFIAKFLGCRIGIYENGKLKKYGNWENEINCLTLVLSFTNEIYSIVFDL